MILRYSRITEYFVSVSTCSPRLSSNWRQFLFNYRLAFSFFFILVLPFTSHLFACYPFQSGSPPVYFLSIQLTSAFPSRCTHSIRSLLPPLFVIVFLSLIYLRSSVSFSLCYSYPFVSFIYIYVSGYRGANRISVWQTRLIFSKGRIFAKNRQNAVAIVELDCSSKMHFFFMEYVIN